MVKTVKEVCVAAIRDTKTWTWTNWMTRSSARSLASNKSNLRSVPSLSFAGTARSWVTCKRSPDPDFKKALQKSTLLEYTGVHAVCEIKGYISNYTQADINATEEMKADYQNTVNHLNKP